MGATARSLTVDGMGQSPTPTRARLEYRLRRGGLSCAVDGYSTSQRFAVDVARAPKALPLAVLFLCPVEVLAICRDRTRLDAALGDWNDRQQRPNSLGWLRAQAKVLAAAGHTAGTSPAVSGSVESRGCRPSHG